MAPAPLLASVVRSGGAQPGRQTNTSRTRSGRCRLSMRVARRSSSSRSLVVVVRWPTAARQSDLKSGDLAGCDAAIYQPAMVSKHRRTRICKRRRRKLFHICPTRPDQVSAIGAALVCAPSRPIATSPAATRRTVAYAPASRAGPSSAPNYLAKARPLFAVAVGAANEQHEQRPARCRLARVQPERSDMRQANKQNSID
jgi:hypothetical protein